MRLGCSSHASLLRRKSTENAALYQRYQAEAERLTDVTFVGRLATYRYYNMDQVVGQALAAFKRIARAHELASASACRLHMQQ